MIKAKNIDYYVETSKLTIKRAENVIYIKERIKTHLKVIEHI